MMKSSKRPTSKLQRSSKHQYFGCAGIAVMAVPQSARWAGMVCRTRLRRPSARQGATNSTLAGGAESFVKLRKAPEVPAYGHQMTDGHGETEGAGYRSGGCGWSLAPDTAVARCFPALPGAVAGEGVPKGRRLKAKTN